MIRAISFDAAGTLIHLAETVGEGYARIASRFGINLDPEETTAAFRASWKALPSPDYKNGPSPDGDRTWWRALVGSVFDRCLGGENPPEAVRAEVFQALYAHYALPESWCLFPEVISVLERLSKRPLRLVVLSNFDPRLRRILAGHRVDHHFDHFVISSEIGSYKPDPAIFAHACETAGQPPSACLHVGDDPVADFGGARSAGLHALHIDRPNSDLESIFGHPNFPT